MATTVVVYRAPTINVHEADLYASKLGGWRSNLHVPTSQVVERHVNNMSYEPEAVADFHPLHSEDRLAPQAEKGRAEVPDLRLLNEAKIEEKRF